MCMILWSALLILSSGGSVAPVIGLQNHTDSPKLQLRRFQFSADFYKKPSGVFNPAAVWNPSLGWVVVFRWDKCFYQRCGIHHTGTTVGPLQA